MGAKGFPFSPIDRSLAVVHRVKIHAVMINVIWPEKRTTDSGRRGLGVADNNSKRQGGNCDFKNLLW